MINLNVLFKKMQKDDKKEVLMFHVVSNELPHADELLKMPGSIVLLTVEDIEPIAAEFVSIQRDNKKTVLKFNIKQDSKGKVSLLYPNAGENVDISLQPSQMTIDEFNQEPHEGIEYSVDGNGNVSVPEDQLSLEDEVENEDEPKLQRVK